MSYQSLASKFAIGVVPQTDLHTANAAADLEMLTRTNINFTKFEPVLESDAAEIGKGHEFATALYKSHYNVSGTIEKLVSSELAAWMFLFGFGTSNASKTAAGTGFKYTVSPGDVCDGLDMPAFTVVEALGKECTPPSPVDRAAIGCVLNSFGLSFQSGPGRQNTRLTAEFVGCGKVASPSNIALPASPLVEHTMSGMSATVTINGVDYVLNKSLVSVDTSFQNNIDLDGGFFVGSGFDDGWALRGRMERSNRSYGLNFVARVESNSTEEAKLKSLTTGPAVITLTGDSIDGTHNHTVKLSYVKVGFKAVEVGDSNGKVVYAVACEPIWDATNGILTVEVTTGNSKIGGLA
ncbi:MAG: hypothetical protein J0H49_10670 [Acidobacteria bacterium]|nr:hypothetical protein [Acidobacteriota bacterium]